MGYVEAGTRVEVRSRFDNSWSRGFEVVDSVADDDEEGLVRVRRLSDGMVLPQAFPQADVRRSRKSGSWWYS